MQTGLAATLIAGYVCALANTAFAQEGSPVLERAAYVRAVLEHNPSIASAQQGWRAASARVRQSGVFDDPMVDLRMAPLSIGASHAPFGYEAAISQRLPWPGKLGFEEAVAKAEAEAARNDVQAVRREVAFSAAVLYDQYFVSVRSLEVNEQHIALMRTLKAGALAQLASGRGSAQDPLQAEAELTHLEHDAVILASERDVVVAQMNELLHRAPESPLPPPVRDLALPNARDTAGGDAKRLGEQAVAQRPEIRAALQRAHAEEARAARARRESYPDVTVSTSYNSMWDMPEHRWMVGLGFNLPLQFGKRAGAVEEANAARARFENDAASLSDKARTEVAVARKRLEESYHVLHLFEERLLPVARDQIDAARAGFIASRNEFVAVIAAEKNLRSVELEYQMARANCDRRRAELDRALGKEVTP
ncbi:TolC family protein [Pendulispora rubella]|uniref:TolC family protein n=1 Tax=Pendulispora rubella TaxID=2741070 RepID=A0ABZ2L8P7_9BACT